MKISDGQPKISDSLKISDFSDSLGVLQHPKHPQQYAYGKRPIARKYSYNNCPGLGISVISKVLSVLGT